MTRDLTDAERSRLERARRKLEGLAAKTETAIQERDLAILEAFNARGNVGQIARAAGMSRTNVYLVLKRLEQGK